MLVLYQFRLHSDMI